jgi:hypothetical protein
MVILVILVNTLISLILLYVAWRMWQLKQQLAYIADWLTAYESCTHIALNKAPENIYISQDNIYKLRQKKSGATNANPTSAANYQSTFARKANLAALFS